MQVLGQSDILMTINVYSGFSSDDPMKPVFFSVVFTCVLSSFACAQSAPNSAAISNAVAAVQQIELHGVGHAEAVEAMKTLNVVATDQIPMLFDAMDGSNEVSANWIRGAIQKSISRSETFPAEPIRAYFDDQTRNPKGRWLAWQLLAKKEPEFRASTIAALATDASMPLREIGIAKLISDAKEIGTDVEKMDDVAKDKKKALLQNALENARDVDQVKSIAKSLAPLGQEVNLRTHLGFIETWNLVSGFDNKEESGFDVIYEPEKDISSLDLSSTYTVGDKNVPWKETTTTEETGVVDLNKVIAKDKGVIAYAVSSFESSADAEAEVRIGTPNAHKIWVNGDLVMTNEVYHNSNSIDKFSSPVKLKQGENQIVIKLCQNEQTEPWAQDWSFQVRFCDATGKAIR
jgi:hypothetical protein